MTDEARKVQPDEFTFCGDLVGMSSLYANAPDKAYDTLSQFYHTVFYKLENYQSAANRGARHVYMFSDSLIVTGDNPGEFVLAMGAVYMALLHTSVLLRGGMVTGRLEFDPRLTRENFEKNLPTGDELARASALEKAVKGPRFIVDRAIARLLVGPRLNWLTLQGYIHDPWPNHAQRLQRSVAPMAPGGGYEILYPVLHETVDDELLNRDLERLRYIESASPPDVAVHYTEAIRLIEHSMARRRHIATATGA